MKFKLKGKVLIVFVVICYIAVYMAGCVVSTAPDRGASDDIKTKASVEEKKNFNETGYPIVNEKIYVKSLYPIHPYYGKAEEMSTWITIEEISNIHIDWDMIESQQLELFFAAGDLPDFFKTSITTERALKYGVEGGLFYDFTEFLEYMPNLQKVFKNYPTAENVIIQDNGEIYTLPKISRSSTSSRTRPEYRTDYVEKVGLNPPETVDEFYNVAKAILDAGLTGGHAPLIPQDEYQFRYRTQPYFYAAFGESIDLDFADDGSGKVVFNRVSEQYKNYLKYMNKLYAEGILENEYLTMDRATTDARTRAGQAAFFNGSGQLLIEEDFPDGIIHLGVLAPLTSEFSSTKKSMGTDFISTGGPAISKKCPYPAELCRMFDMWYSTEEIVPGSGFWNVCFVYGVYGKDWQYIDEERTKFERIIPDWWESSSGEYGYKYITWEFDYGLIDHMMVGGEGNSLIRQLGYIENDIPYQRERFPAHLIKFRSDEQSLVASKYTDIESYVGEMCGKYIAGIEPIDATWDAYCATLEKMGINDVLAAYQAAYDRFIK